MAKMQNANFTTFRRFQIEWRTIYRQRLMAKRRIAQLLLLINFKPSLWRPLPLHDNRRGLGKNNHDQTGHPAKQDGADVKLLKNENGYLSAEIMRQV